MYSQQFIQSQLSEPHRIRTKQILKQYPEVRSLIGKNPYTIFVIAALVAAQLGIAVFLSGESWWLVTGVAYIIGAFIIHALFVMIHECTHQLLFKGKTGNRLAGLLANLPQLFPTAIAFERYHIKHHSFLGVYELDGDLPNHWEARLISSYAPGKMLWLLLYPFFQVLRLSRLKEVRSTDGWMLGNIAVQLLFTAIFWWLVGTKAIVFLLLSFFFSVGLHPLGARWIQEHYVVKEGQETYSYYGMLNRVAFNMGYHNEHHDFPSVPWNRLPQLRRAAPPFYDNLYYHTSWTKLLFRFLFCQEITLFSRIVRKERGKVPISDGAIHDKELSEKMRPAGEMC